MALARLGGARRPENYTSPGFVDALATLLMVIIFVTSLDVVLRVPWSFLLKWLSGLWPRLP